MFMAYKAVQQFGRPRKASCLGLLLLVRNNDERHFHHQCSRPIYTIHLMRIERIGPIEKMLHSSHRTFRTSSLALAPFFKDRYELTLREHKINTLCFSLGCCVLMVGLTFAALPMYRMFCESTGFAGTTQVAKSLERIEQMEPVQDRLIRVQFNADVPSSMQWKFKPVQDEIYVYPGETALAFFTAKNPTDRPIIGISTYNVTPFQAAYYFNKIQCFCFDEQILNPGEDVDLPVFFYIDPDVANDPDLEQMKDLMLSYTFFESKTDLKLPSPFDPTNRPLTNAQKSKSNVAPTPIGNVG